METKAVDISMPGLFLVPCTGLIIIIDILRMPNVSQNLLV